MTKVLTVSTSDFSRRLAVYFRADSRRAVWVLPVDETVIQAWEVRAVVMEPDQASWKELREWNGNGHIDRNGVAA